MTPTTQLQLFPPAGATIPVSVSEADGKYTATIAGGWRMAQSNKSADEAVARVMENYERETRR